MEFVTINLMPTYHFRCQECGAETERKLPFGSTEVPTCETCEKPMTKVIVPPMVHFKGTGFYKTDSSAPAKPAAKEAPKETHAPKPADPKPETKK